MKTGLRIALPILALLVGAGLGLAHKHIRMANAKARLAQEQQEQSDRDAMAARACRDAGGVPIYSFTWRFAVCYQPPRATPQKNEN